MARHLAPAAIERLDRSEADGRYVEPHVLLRFGDFHDGEAALGAQLAGAADAFVGAFDGFDRHDGPAFDGDALADVEPAHFLGERPAEVDVLLFADWSGRGGSMCRQVTRSSGAKSVAGAMVMPLLANSSTTTLSSVSSLRFFLPRKNRGKNATERAEIGNERKPAAAIEEQFVLENFTGESGLLRRRGGGNSECACRCGRRRW